MNNRPIYILGSPRTGSTLLYQILSKCCDKTLYITNEGNDNYANGFNNYLITNYQKIIDYKPNVSFVNKFGKTQNSLDPSEGSNVFTNWFGGGHPSEQRSSKLLNSSIQNFLNVHNLIKEQLGLQFLNKNAWNCFRIKNIVESGVKPQFIVIRRNIFSSSLSDFDSRLNIGDPNEVWNSASPSNYFEIKKKPGYQQSVDQQYFFNKSMLNSFKESGCDFVEIWYEDLCSDYVKTLGYLSDYLGTQISTESNIDIRLNNSKNNVPKTDIELIRKYVKSKRKEYASIYKYYQE